MSDDSDRTLTAADVAVLAKAARLPLKPGRAEAAAEPLDGIMKSFDLLDDVDVGETPPTNSFDARWRN